MEMLQEFLTTPIDFLKTYILPFVLVLSVLVFVHEWGHYIVARLCGVKVKKFSIGFGSEIFGWTDKSGTRWKFSWIPLGGYVQMFGDIDPASTKHSDVVEEGDQTRPFTEEERKVAFFTQSIAKRSAIIAAGPGVNFLFAIIILTSLYAINGQPFTPPIVAKLVVDSPAEKAGILPDDKFLAMNGRPIERFQDMAQYTAVNLNKSIEITLVRSIGEGRWSDQPVIVNVTPALVESTDRFGFKSQRGRIGVISPSKPFAMKEHTVISAFGASFKTVWEISTDTLKAIGQMIMGTRSADELGGILRIGAYAADFAERGFTALVIFTALLSVNLGLVNILPIPMLDGGHLAFYAMETVRGKPMSERFQEYSLRVGLATLLGIMLFATWNDLVQLDVFGHIKNLIF